MRVHWAGGVHTMLHVPKNRVGRNAKATDQSVVELVLQLAKVQSDSAIAATLNRLGLQTGPGNSWNQTRVKNLRQHHRIAVFEPSADHPWLTMAEAASALQVGVGVVRTMLKHQLLPARQIAKGAPWIIQREEAAPVV